MSWQSVRQKTSWRVDIAEHAAAAMHEQNGGFGSGAGAGRQIFAHPYRHLDGRRWRDRSPRRLRAARFRSWTRSGDIRCARLAERESRAASPSPTTSNRAALRFRDRASNVVFPGACEQRERWIAIDWSAEGLAPPAIVTQSGKPTLSGNTCGSCRTKRQGPAAAGRARHCALSEAPSGRVENRRSIR